METAKFHLFIFDVLPMKQCLKYLTIIMLATVLHNSTVCASTCACPLDINSENTSCSLSQAPTPQQIIHNFYNYLSSLQKCTSSVDLVQVPTERYILLPAVIIRSFCKTDKENQSVANNELFVTPPYPPSYYLFALKRIMV